MKQLLYWHCLKRIAWDSLMLRCHSHIGGAVKFMQSMYEQCLKLFRNTMTLYCNILQQFNSVKLLDSSHVILPANVADMYKGCGACYQGRSSTVQSSLNILEVQINILNLKLPQVKLGYYRHNTELKALVSALLTLLKRITKYNFIPRINSGDSLLVGEGNLSFSVSLMKKLQQLPRCITSTYEDYDDLSEAAQLNAYKLRKFGINVLHNVNATKLHKTFNHNSFDTIS
ncbi:MAG: DUF2431 domain-containing protein [Rickettsia endosymbiont of Ixodes persulcatus]|nr:DUF2431 domain-containing protein [Rickettsia endosymbiont of Ixodes persulcatus]